MKERINLELTKSEFEAMIDLADTISAMRGVGTDFDKKANKNLRFFDRMLRRNGYKRNSTTNLNSNLRGVLICLN